MAKKVAKKKRAPRNYKREYTMYHATEEQKKRRAKRNGDRRKVQAARKKAGKRPLRTKEELNHGHGMKSYKVTSRRANRKAGSPGKRKKTTTRRRSR